MHAEFWLLTGLLAQIKFFLHLLPQWWVVGHQLQISWTELTASKRKSIVLIKPNHTLFPLKWIPPGSIVIVLLSPRRGDDMNMTVTLTGNGAINKSKENIFTDINCIHTIDTQKWTDVNPE